MNEPTQKSDQPLYAFNPSDSSAQPVTDQFPLTDQPSGLRRPGAALAGSGATNPTEPATAETINPGSPFLGTHCEAARSAYASRVLLPNHSSRSDTTISNSEFVISNSAQSAAALCPRAFFQTYLPHHCRNPFNPMHEFSFIQYQRQHSEPLPARTGRRLAIAAPRGAAKSTLHSMLFPIMDILTGRERHQVIISGTMAQSKNRIATIVRELRTNPAIRDTFFGGKAPKFKSNTRSIEIGNCRIEAFSAKSEMRGVSHGEFRPTRIILDDVEQSTRATKQKFREELVKWYDEVVENLGDTYTHITIVGTVLHTDSLLSNLINRPGFKGEHYKSIIQWDNQPELWNQWQKLFTDRSDPDAVDTAQAFFEQNKEAMLEGTEVFWPEKEPYIKLQEKLLILGRSAFFKQNLFKDCHLDVRSLNQRDILGQNLCVFYKILFNSRLRAIICSVRVEPKYSEFCHWHVFGSVKRC